MIGQVVRLAQEQGVRIDQLALAICSRSARSFRDDVQSVFDFQAAVARRNVPGGTAPRCSRRPAARELMAIYSSRFKFLPSFSLSES
jgi:argininosuccinate lyase